MDSQGRFAYERLAKYPHMNKEDVITWERFIEQFPNAYVSVDYDYTVGTVEEHSALAADLGVDGAERVNQYKVDVIGYRDSEVHIIEVKNKALPSAIGQVLTYHLLYNEDNPDAPEATPIIIARECSHDLERIANEHGVTLILV